MLAWVESVNFAGVLAVAFLPSLIAVGVFYAIRATPWSHFRLVGLAPLGPGFLLGLVFFQELSRPGVKEFLGVGGKKTALYLLVLAVPLFTAGFLVWQDMRTRRLETRR